MRLMAASCSAESVAIRLCSNSSLKLLYVLPQSVLASAEAEPALTVMARTVTNANLV
jgi:hypothetical protein